MRRGFSSRRTEVFAPFRRKCQVTNRRALPRYAAATRQKLAYILFSPVWFCFVTWAPRTRTYAAKIAVTADHAYARIARGSLWPSVTVYSFRSYSVPVALKKSQSTRGKYACVPDDGERRCDPLRYVATVAGTLINICLRCFRLEINVFAPRMFLVSATRIVIWFCHYQ